MPEVEWLEDWRESLIWCPSQLYRKFRIRYEDGSVSPPLTLYLRWRWSDPWSCYIIQEGYERVNFLTDDLFEESGLYFRDEEYREAEKAAEQLVERLVKSGGLNFESRPETLHRFLSF